MWTARGIRVRCTLNVFACEPVFLCYCHRNCPLPTALLFTVAVLLAACPLHHPPLARPLQASLVGANVTSKSNDEGEEFLSQGVKDSSFHRLAFFVLFFSPEGHSLTLTVSHAHPFSAHFHAIMVTKPLCRAPFRDAESQARKRHMNVNLFVRLVLGRPRVCPGDFTGFVPGTNPVKSPGQTRVFALFYTVEARFHRVCPWDKPGLSLGQSWG